MYTFRGGSAYQWRNWDPKLPRHQIGVELDTGRYKVGDGDRRWLRLRYASETNYPRFRVTDTDLEVLRAEAGSNVEFAEV